MLKYTKTNSVDVSDWDSLVVETYGKPYSFQQQDGCKERGTYYLSVPSSVEDNFENDTVPDIINGKEMGVSFAAWLARDVKEWNGDPKNKNSIELFWTRNFYPTIESIANDLHAKGLIETGDYVIDIDW